MIRRPTLWTLIILLIGNICFAQDVEMIAYGRVVDVRTNKGIKAIIQYSSIPTGGLHGDFYDSTFSFQIFGTARYKVTAEAEGYAKKTLILDPKEMGSDLRLVKNIELTPKGEAIRLMHLIFSQGKAEIDPLSFHELDGISLMMKDNSNMVIQLEGHTDNVGSPEANLKLSQERVDAVKKYLVKKGVSKNRIKTKAFGGSQPLKNEMTPEAKALNRRVEMRILKS
jgi:OmpA-OmpF porin, OOP family